jgi:hypothetical protein
VHRVTIGFNAVADLAAGKVDAATAFWNAEGVELQQQGIASREFRVDDFGAPRYPELVIATSARNAGDMRNPSTETCDFLQGLARGYQTLGQRPRSALSDLLQAVPDASESALEPQLASLLQGQAFLSASDRTGTRLGVVPSGAKLTASLNQRSAPAWLAWAESTGIIHAVGDSPAAVRIASGFRPDLLARHCTS